MVVAQLSWRGWVSGVRAIMRGEGVLTPADAGRRSSSPSPPTCARGCATSKTSTAARRARKPSGPPSGCARCCARSCGDQVIVVSNREPYIHERSDDGSIVVKRPASGLVTAVEPVMRACSGTWIAHGSGSADRDVVDARRPRRRAAGAARPTGCAASGSPRKRSRATTTASPTRACGRCATWRTCGRCSASPTGRPTARSTSASPTRWWPRRAARTRWCWCRTTTSRCCRRWSASSCRRPRS